MNDTISFAGLNFRGLSRNQLLQDDDKFRFIVTVNAEFINIAHKEEKFANIINNNYSTFDGQITYYLAKIKNRKKDFEIISGCDFIYDCCKYCIRNDKKVFLLGGGEVSNNNSILILRDKYPGLKIDGFSPEYKPYPFTKSHNDLIIDHIKRFKPHFLFVGFGAKKQEYWIDENKEILNEIGVRWVVGSGGTFEFVAIFLKKPPDLVKKLGFFSIYRLLQEPKFFRIKRILISLSIIKFLFKRQ